MYVRLTFVLLGLVFGFVFPTRSWSGEIPLSRLSGNWNRNPMSLESRQAQEMLMDSKASPARIEDRASSRLMPQLIGVCRSTRGAYSHSFAPSSRYPSLLQGYEGCVTAAPEGAAASQTGAALLLPFGR